MTAIVVDSSAIIAILHNEPERERFIAVIFAASARMMSAVSLQEVSMVHAGRLAGDDDWTRLDALLTELGIEIVAHDTALAHRARDAFLRFGKGRHPARLNFGDCASYALARAQNLPLLFKGNDFTQTDIHAA